MPLSKALYDTCFIRGQGCKWWSRLPKLTSLVISDATLSFTFLNIVYTPHSRPARFNYGQGYFNMVLLVDSTECISLLLFPDFIRFMPQFCNQLVCRNFAMFEEGSDLQTPPILEISLLNYDEGFIITVTSSSVVFAQQLAVQWSLLTLQVYLIKVPAAQASTIMK